MNANLDEVAYNDAGWPDVAVNLARLGQVGDAGVRAHQHVHRVQRPLKEAPLSLRQVDPAQRRFRQVVVRHQRCNTSINQPKNLAIKQTGAWLCDTNDAIHQSTNLQINQTGGCAASALQSINQSIN
jgi:hypothetical protein